MAATKEQLTAYRTEGLRDNCLVKLMEILRDMCLAQSTV